MTHPATDARTEGRRKDSTRHDIQRHDSPTSRPASVRSTRYVSNLVNLTG
jgi:hypothetical protein